MCCLQSQLAALAARCGAPEDLVCFLTEAAALTGLMPEGSSGSARHVLAELLRCLAHYKSPAAFGSSTAPGPGAEDGGREAAGGATSETF